MPCLIVNGEYFQYCGLKSPCTSYLYVVKYNFEALYWLLTSLYNFKKFL